VRTVYCRCRLYTCCKPRNARLPRLGIVLLIVLDCENYEKERKVMMETVMDFVDTKNAKRSARITEELLLTPVNYNNISKRNMTFIKEALFEGLTKSQPHDRTVRPLCGRAVGPR